MLFYPSLIKPTNNNVPIQTMSVIIRTQITLNFLSINFNRLLFKRKLIALC